MVRVVKCSQYLFTVHSVGHGLPLLEFCFFFFFFNLFLSLLEPWTVDTCSKRCF